jgi:hypothetical protein
MSCDLDINERWEVQENVRMSTIPQMLTFCFTFDMFEEEEKTENKIFLIQFKSILHERVILCKISMTLCQD